MLVEFVQKMSLSECHLGLLSNPLQITCILILTACILLLSFAQECKYLHCFMEKNDCLKGIACSLLLLPLGIQHMKCALKYLNLPIYLCAQDFFVMKSMFILLLNHYHG